MKAIAERRARITRVREVQHLQAASDAATAENKVVQLEGNAARLSALRTSLTMAPGMTSGAAFGNAAELGTRLDHVRSGLETAIGAARANAVHAASLRLAANIAKESAARLETRAVAELQDMIEARMAASIRHRGKEQRDG